MEGSVSVNAALNEDPIPLVRMIPEDHGWAFGSGVFVKGTGNLMRSPSMLYAEPVFWTHQDAEAYIEKHLTAVEQELSEIRRIHYHIEIRFEACREFVKLPTDGLPDNACSACGYMRGAHK